MKEKLTPIIIDQTRILYANLEEILSSIKETMLYDEHICDWPLGEQIFHMLHSMDQWFINPNIYSESGISLLKRKTNKRLSKTELAEYFKSVRNKIANYLDELDEEALSEPPEGSQFSKLVLILGQYRHFMYHIGLIHGCLRIHSKGKSPIYYGLSLPSKSAIKEC